MSHWPQLYKDSKHLIESLDKSYVDKLNVEKQSCSWSKGELKQANFKGSKSQLWLIIGKSYQGERLWVIVATQLDFFWGVNLEHLHLKKLETTSWW